MRHLSSQIGSQLVLALVLLVGCSLPGRLDNAAATGGAHAGWGVAAPAEARTTIDRPTVVKPEAASGETHQEDPSAEPVSEPVAVVTEPVAGPAPAGARTAEAPAATERLDATLRARQPEAGARDASPRTVSTAPTGTSVTRVSFADRSDGKGLVVRIHSTGPIPAFRVEEASPGLVEVTLFQTELGGSVMRGEPRGPVRQYSLQANSGRTVLALTVDQNIRLESRAYPDRDSHDLLVSLTVAPRQVASGSRPALAAAAPAAGSSSSGADAASLENWRLDCIVIDAGHGGRDPGAVAHGVRESDVTLGIALKLGRYVEENLGVRVVYTRRDDRFVELVDRGRIANESCGKLFVSIHANSARNHHAHGTETYFLGMHRTESARQVMERENSVIALESNPSLYSGMDEGALIMQSMAQSSYLRISEQLSGLIEYQFANRAGRTSRGVKQAGFLVLWKASMPAVLVETGFVSNRDEARFLSSNQGQDLIASAIYRAIREYKEQYERGLGVAVN